jgi:hypothetical protein
MAAVLATKGTLSHRSAGAALGILGSSVLEVTVPERRRRPGIHIHCSPLPEDEVTRLDGIPVTTAARTIFDLAAVLPKSHVERALNEAEIYRIGGGPSVPILLQRYPRRHGSPMLKDILASRRGVTRSELEAKFSALADLAGLPPSQRNVRIEAQGHWYECDCVWREQRLIVELDSRAYHLNIAAFERDRARDRRLQVAGWRVIRVTWRQLEEDLPAVASDIGDLLHR